MKQLTKQIFALLLCNAMVILPTQAQEHPTPINPAVSFLRINPETAASGSGNVGLATIPISGGAFWNPAKSSFAREKGGIAANYTPWLRDLAGDMYLASVSGYYKWKEDQAFHSSLRYFSMGSLQFKDENGAQLQLFKAREWAVDAGYSRKLSQKSSLGLTLRYIHSNLAGQSAGGNDYKAGDAVAADLGYYYNGQNTVGNGWTFGAALTNLGSKLSYYKTDGQKKFIPANLGLGVAYTKVFDEHNKISLGLDLNKLMVPSNPPGNDAGAWADYYDRSVTGSWFRSFGDASFANELKECQLSGGAEYWYNNLFAVRAGYSWEDKSQGNRKFLTFGASVKYAIWALHFAYITVPNNATIQSPLNQTWRFGAVVDILK